MTFSVDQMKSLISAKGGLAMANLWKVQLPSLPGVVSSYELNMLCKDVTLPGRQMLTQERTIGMKQRKVAYGYASEDVSMTFLVMNDYGIKDYFEAWSESMINFETKELKYKDTYSHDVTISQLKKRSVKGAELNFNINLLAKDPSDIFNFDIKTDEVVYTCKLTNAFPTTMNAMTLNNEQNGLLEYNVQLSYDDWQTV